MMQDFAIPRSPAAARRLRALAQVIPLDLSEAIHALAEEGLLGPDDFARLPDLTETERSATQRVLDVGFRGMLLTDSVSAARKTALSALALTPDRQAIIATPAVRPWLDHCAEYGFVASQNPNDRPECLIVSHESLMSQPVLSDRRGGVLILDQQDRTGSHAGEHAYQIGSKAAREVGRTLFVQNYGAMLATFHGWSRACDVRLQTSLEELWPDRALSILNQSQQTVSSLKGLGFTRVRSCHLYFLFNVIADLLGERQPK